MPSKNNLSAFKADTSKAAILPTAEEGRGAKKSPGRPKKGAAKRSHKVVLSLTEAEGDIIKQKAGLTPEATFLYALLNDAGAFK